MSRRSTRLRSPQACSISRRSIGHSCSIIRRCRTTCIWTDLEHATGHGGGETSTTGTALRCAELLIHLQSPSPHTCSLWVSRRSTRLRSPQACSISRRGSSNCPPQCAPLHTAKYPVGGPAARLHHATYGRPCLARPPGLPRSSLTRRLAQMVTLPDRSSSKWRLLIRWSSRRGSALAPTPPSGVITSLGSTGSTDGLASAPLGTGALM